MELKVQKSWMTDVKFTQKETFAKGSEFKYLMQKGTISTKKSSFLHNKPVKYIVQIA